MKEFEKWYYYVKSDGKLWPSFGRYDTENEHIAAKEAWKAALEWVRDNAGGDSSDSRDVYGDVIKELEETE